MTQSESHVLDAILDGWERSNAALVNLLRALPDGALEPRATPTNPTIGQHCAHIHHERVVSVLENAPEHAGALPADEWADARDVAAVARMLVESSRRVCTAVHARSEAGRPLDRIYTHPLQLVQFLIFHDGYHHGQITLALKVAGVTIPDDLLGPLVWDVWRAR